MHPIPVVGAGLAGSEAALQIAACGLSVRLFEMRPLASTGVHQGDRCAELVCSNSLGSRLPGRAAGHLQEELDLLGSRLLALAREHAVPAGQALAVDREAFAEAVTAAIVAEPRIELVREEKTALPEEPVAIVASGPLTSPSLAAALQDLAGREHLFFFDALAPVVVAESLDRKVLFPASRWNLGQPDYWNLPLGREEYTRLVEQILSAERHAPKPFEETAPGARAFFERCLPVEILASRGLDTLRFGPLRPVGLSNPRTGRRPFAVIQFRPENREGSLYNLVGFQTSLKYGEQERILRALPGMAEAEFVRLGSMHRNTFLCSPELLDPTLEFRQRPGLFLAGQVSGMEGYLSNIGSGLLAGRNAVRRARGEAPETLPRTTLLGALASHVATAPAASFQPMKAEFGLLPPLTGPRLPGAERRAALAARALTHLKTHLHANPLTGSASAVA